MTSTTPIWRRRLVAKIMIAVGAFATVLMADMPSAAADWADDNCIIGDPGLTSGARTAQSMYSRHYTARYEGYHWGGGCWNDNDIDDAPGYEPERLTPRGEGPDCSGFVFKAWAIQAANTTSFRLYRDHRFEHGPFRARSYRTSQTAWKTIAKTHVGFWDAFASTGHIGLQFMYTTNGADLIFEAKGEAAGTGIFARTYRSDSSYTGAERNGWSHK